MISQIQNNYQSQQTGKNKKQVSFGMKVTISPKILKQIHSRRLEELLIEREKSKLIHEGIEIQMTPPPFVVEGGDVLIINAQSFSSDHQPRIIRDAAISPLEGLWNRMRGNHSFLVNVLDGPTPDVRKIGELNESIELAQKFVTHWEGVREYTLTHDRSNFSSHIDSNICKGNVAIKQAKMEIDDLSRRIISYMQGLARNSYTVTQFIDEPVKVFRGVTESCVRSFEKQEKFYQEQARKEHTLAIAKQRRTTKEMRKWGVAQEEQRRREALIEAYCDDDPNVFAAKLPPAKK